MKLQFWYGPVRLESYVHAREVAPTSARIVEFVGSVPVQDGAIVPVVVVPEVVVVVVDVPEVAVPLLVAVVVVVLAVVQVVEVVVPAALTVIVFETSRLF